MKYEDNNKSNYLPLYPKTPIIIPFLILCLILTLITALFYFTSSLENNIIFILVLCSLVAVYFGIMSIIIYLSYKPSKILSLIKDESIVAKYDQNIKPTSRIIELCDHFDNNLWKDVKTIKRDCERVILNNDMEIWSCYVSERYDHYRSTYINNTYHTFVFGKIDTTSDLYIYIDKYTKNDSKERLYIPTNKKLPPFIIDGLKAQVACAKIEQLCSDFFGRTKDDYILIIKNDTIELGLRGARLGEKNEIINHEKTITLTKQAIDEIEEFLNKINNELKNI